MGLSRMGWDGGSDLGLLRMGRGGRCGDDECRISGRRSPLTRSANRIFFFSTALLHMGDGLYFKIPDLGELKWI